MMLRSCRAPPARSGRAARGLAPSAVVSSGPRHSLRGVPSRAGRQARLRVSAIGFSFDDDSEPENVRGRAAPPGPKISTLTTLASTLLVYVSVLKGSVGEAFLSTLIITGKYQASNKDVLAAYAKLYNLLQQAGMDSWEEYLMEQILTARDNAFARAVAQGSLNEGAPALKAVAYDLDVLQKLSVRMSRLAEYIGEAAPVAGPYWVMAASSVAMKSDSLLLPSSAAPLPALNLNMPSKFIQKPPTSDEVRAWGECISNKESWSEATPVLQQYYHLHGFGITSRNSALRWNKGAFEEGNEGNLALAPLSALTKHQEVLAANTARFCAGKPAQHCLVAGPSGSGKSWLLWESTLLAGKDAGVRVVEVSSTEQHALLEVARGAGRYPRIRFIIVADNVDMPLRGNMAADLMAGLSNGSGPAGWPSNVLLYIGVTPTSTLSFDPVVSRFGTVVTTSDLSEEQFATTLTELAGGELPTGVASMAVQWAKSRDGLTIRNASLYASMNT
ncbi:hypothetical protein FOA52_010377 [Chlamydomonas sp. UWO 241]|nr:hypothetical protein FOA52_010377 [Chlamydomonas sp. UWO 241]